MANRVGKGILSVALFVCVAFSGSVAADELLDAPNSRIVTETGELLDGTGFRQFVLYGDDGLDRFAARLIDGSKTLEIGWTDHLPRTLLRLRETQQLAGGVGAFTRITGTASDQLEILIKAGKFNADDAAELLGRSLGGRWKVEVIKRDSGIYEIIASLLD